MDHLQRVNETLESLDPQVSNEASEADDQFWNLEAPTFDDPEEAIKPQSYSTRQLEETDLSQDTQVQGLDVEEPLSLTDANIVQLDEGNKQQTLGQSSEEELLQGFPETVTPDLADEDVPSDDNFSHSLSSDDEAFGLVPESYDAELSSIHPLEEDSPEPMVMEIAEEDVRASLSDTQGSEVAVDHSEPEMVLKVGNMRLDALQVLNSCETPDGNTLYYVQMHDTFALMAHHGLTFEVLKFFESNPMASEQGFSVRPAAKMSGQDVLEVNLGSWKGLLTQSSEEKLQVAPV
jgi:hypothetical protein